MKDFEKQLGLLVAHQIDFVVIGGVAAAIYGSSIVTYDLDICYARAAPNLEKLAFALVTVNARLRGAPEGLPFILDAETLRHGLNFTFTTDIGDIDLLAEVRGVGGYEEALEGATRSVLFGNEYLILALEKLILAKRAAGRPKDLVAIPELEAICETRRLFDDEIGNRVEPEDSERKLR